MLSRVADSIFWLNRYIERAENTARFVDANLNLSMDLPRDMDEQWGPLVDTTGDGRIFAELFKDRTRENVLRFLISSDKYPSSIYNCLKYARENARSMRDFLSATTWEHLNRFYLEVRDAMTDIDAIVRDPLPFIGQVQRNALYFEALLDTTTCHGEGWHFGALGRLLERADKTARLLDVKYFVLLPNAEAVGSPFDLLQWSTVLRSANAYSMYSQEYGPIAPRAVAEFLILSNEFPRSIRFCATRAEESLRAINDSGNDPAHRKLGRFRSDLDYADINEIFELGMHEYLDGLQKQINRVGDALTRSFFDPQD